MPEDDNPLGFPEDKPLVTATKSDKPEGVGKTNINNNDYKGVGASSGKEVTVTPDNESGDNESDNDDVTVTPYEPYNNQPEDSLYENIDRTMDQQYGTRQRENMRPRNRKNNLLPKLRVNLVSDAAKRAKTKEVNETVHAMSSKYIGLNDYVHLYSKRHCQYGLETNIMKDPMVATVLTQYHVSKGIKVFGDPGIEAVTKEIKQLHEMLVIYPKTPEGLTRDENKAALQYFMFLRRKRCGKIKGIVCADGQKQREYMSKD